MAKIYTHQLEVRAYELDSFGHVNHANYLHYLETARWKMLGEENFTLETFKKWDRWPVIANLDIQYLKPIFMNETITIETHLAGYKTSSMQIEQVIKRGDAIIAQAKIRSVIVDGKGKPSALPDELAERWRSQLL